METNILIDFLKRVGFKENLGYYVKDDFKIFLEDGIICHEKENFLFQTSKNVSMGCLLVLFQEYRIIHERFIYERVEHLGEQFLECEDYDEE